VSKGRRRTESEEFTIGVKQGMGKKGKKVIKKKKGKKKKEEDVWGTVNQDNLVGRSLDGGKARDRQGRLQKSAMWTKKSSAPPRTQNTKCKNEHGDALREDIRLAVEG